RYCRQQTKPKRVVTFVADTGNKYLSKMYNDFWMAEQGFIHRAPHGGLSDLISHRYEAGEVVSVGPGDSLLTAFKRMRQADVSQSSWKATNFSDSLRAPICFLICGCTCRSHPCRSVANTVKINLESRNSVKKSFRSKSPEISPRFLRF